MQDKNFIILAAAACLVIPILSFYTVRAEKEDPDLFVTSADAEVEQPGSGADACKNSCRKTEGEASQDVGNMAIQGAAIAVANLLSVGILGVFLYFQIKSLKKVQLHLMKKKCQSSLILS